MNDLVQIISWIVGIIATLFAVLKALNEMRENREQRERDFLWEKVRFAHDLMEKIWSDKNVLHAVRMLTWKAQKYTLDSGGVITLTKTEILNALRTENLIFNDKEKYVRACISDFFHKLGRIEHFIQRGLIDFDDVCYSFSERVVYFHEDGDIYKKFLNYYEMNSGIKFFERCEEHLTSQQTASDNAQEVN